MSNITEHSRWLEADGDNTLRLDYPLSNDSIVLDIGAYDGKWAKRIYDKYNCSMYLSEPVSVYYNKAVTLFSGIENVHIDKTCVGTMSGDINISIDNDASSMYVESKNIESAPIIAIDEYLLNHGILFVDLLKMNIEGAEYDLLDYMLVKGLVCMISDIQIQFHDFIDGAKERREHIQKELSKTHELTYNFDFVWENWRLK